MEKIGILSPSMMVLKYKHKLVSSRNLYNLALNNLPKHQDRYLKAGKAPKE